jgi:DNA-binding response OmpR family regulator
MMKIHLVDDDKKLFELLKVYFDGIYDLTVSYYGRDAIDYLRNNSPDLVILDVMLPEINGFDICKIIRKEKPLLPIIMLTAMTDNSDKITGLELGADDYISKPFNPRELSARIKSVVRRFELDENELHDKNKFVYSSIWDIKLNLENRSVLYKDKNITLTLTEFELLKELLINIGIIQTREHLITKLKGFDVNVNDRLIDSYIKRLRQKLDDKEMIKTSWGLGYIIEKNV